jgi:hypothetical protein
VKGGALRAVAVPSSGLAQGETSPRSSAGAPLRIVSRFDSVQIWRAGASAPCLLKGQPARLFSELMAVGGPMRWQALAVALWPGEEPEALRHRLDVTLARARRALQEAGIRRDLVTAHRNGQLEVLLYPGDHADEAG